MNRPTHVCIHDKCANEIYYSQSLLTWVHYQDEDPACPEVGANGKTTYAKPDWADGIDD